MSTVHKPRVTAAVWESEIEVLCSHENNRFLNANFDNS